MRSPSRPAVAAARALLVSSTSLGLGAGAHVLAGGHRPPWVALLVAAALSTVGAAPLARRALHPASLLPYAALSQAASHLAITWLPATDPTAALATAGAHHGGTVLWSAPTTTAAPLGAGAAMLAWHLLGTAITVLALVGAERAATDAAHWWAGVLQVGAPSPLPAVGRPAPAAHTAAVPPWRRSAPAAPRRGPPVPVPA